MTQITDLGPLYEECECGRAKLCKTTYERSMDAADARVEALENLIADYRHIHDWECEPVRCPCPTCEAARNLLEGK